MANLYDKDGNIVGHIAGRTSPKAQEREAPDGKCLDCGGRLESEYGFCKFGLGGFARCMECFEVFNFCEDRG